MLSCVLWASLANYWAWGWVVESLVYEVRQFSSQTNRRKSATHLIAEYHYSHLNALALGRYAKTPAPSPPFKVFPEWPPELYSYYPWCHECHQNIFLRYFLYLLVKKEVTEGQIREVGGVFQYRYSLTDWKFPHRQCHVSRRAVTKQGPWIVDEKFSSTNIFTQPFLYFQTVNFINCLSSCYKCIMNNPSISKKSLATLLQQVCELNCQVLYSLSLRSVGDWDLWLLSNVEAACWDWACECGVWC